MPKQICPQTPIQNIVNETTAFEDEAQGQQATAESYGFTRWRHLELFLEDSKRLFANEVAFERLACIDYMTYAHNFTRAVELLEEAPELARSSIYHACSAGDVEAVKAFIDQDSSLVSQPGGFFDWEPLMYACYSRLQVPGNSTTDVARLLLKHGASPNAFYMWGGQYKFTALTGVFGEGEHGPGNFPQHPNCAELARLLLEHKAEPNDSQALYNRMFTPGSLCLELLVEFGLGADSHSNWLLEEHGSLVPNQKQTLQYQLQHAISAGYTDRAKLCVENGADLSDPDEGRPFYERALLAGNEQLAEYLVSRGARRCQLDRTTAFAAACLNNDEAAAREMLDSDDTLLDDTQLQVPELINGSLDSGRYETIQLLHQLGVDLEKHHTPLHTATWAGDLQMVQLLIQLGCDPQRLDRSHNATPMQWATYRKNRRDIIQFLATCDIDIFDAVLSGEPAAIKRVVAAAPSSLDATFDSIRGNVGEPEARKDTPLVRAVRDENINAVRTLIELNATRKFVSPNGQSLADFARERGAVEISELLD